MATGISRVSGQGSGTSSAYPYAGDSTLFAAFSNNVTSGNLLVMGCVVAGYSAADYATTSNFTKGAGSATLGTITLDATYASSDFQLVSIFSAPVTGSGDCTMQLIQTGSAGYSSVALQEYTGADVSVTRLDGTAVGTGTSLTPATGTVTAPSQGGAFFGGLAYNTEEEGAVFVNGPGYSNVYTTSDENYVPCSFQDHLTSSGDTSNASWTITGIISAVPYSAALAVYKATAGGTITSTYDTPYIYVGGQWQTVIGAYRYNGSSWDSAETCQEYISGTWQ